MLRFSGATMREKQRQIQGPDVIQFMGLLLLIDAICKCFRPGAHPHVTVSLLVAFVAGLFLLIWPMALKARN
jgi:hypothetical protein